MNSLRFHTLFSALPLLWLIAILLPLGLHWGELPNPMATHWDGSGQPNGSLPPIVLLAVGGGLLLAVWSGVRRSLRRSPWESRSFATGLFGVAGLLAGITWTTVELNRGRVTWEEAAGFGIGHLLAVLGAAIVAGLIGFAIAGRPPARPGAAPSIDVLDAGHSIWSGRGTGRVLQVAGFAVLAVGLARWGWHSVLMVVVALLILLFAEVRVTISKRGSLISLGWLGLISWEVPLSDIDHAEVETLSPMAFGGWGYRTRPGIRAIITRGGEALRLVRPSKADLLVTVDDAETGAGLINAILANEGDKAR